MRQVVLFEDKMGHLYRTERDAREADLKMSVREEEDKVVNRVLQGPHLKAQLQKYGQARRSAIEAEIASALRNAYKDGNLPA